MAWTTPQTWTQSLVSVSDLNAQVRDNLNFLFDPTEDFNTGDKGSNYTTTSASFSAIDTAGGDDLRLTITPSGEDIEIELDCDLGFSATAIGYLHLYIDGVAVADGDGLCVVSGTTNVLFTHAHMHWVARALSQASHTFDVYWKVSGGVTLTLYNGAGTASHDSHPVYTGKKS